MPFFQNRKNKDAVALSGTNWVELMEIDTRLGGVLMARWLFSFNVPLVLDNFFWLVFMIGGIIGIATGIYAIKHIKKTEELMPRGEEYAAFEAKESERLAAKAAKKQKPVKAAAE